jgi:hypothetical protein
MQQFSLSASEKRFLMMNLQVDMSEGSTLAEIDHEECGDIY